MISEGKYCKSCMTRDDLCPPTQGETKHATQNACKMCAPLGASLAFAGIQGCISILHGSQGCATYIRRYLISHFREPMDIASSSFSEEDAIFGGGRNLKMGIDNVCEAYSPEVIGIATTCLAETIGEDVPQILREYRNPKIPKHGKSYPPFCRFPLQATPEITGKGITRRCDPWSSKSASKIQCHPTLRVMKHRYSYCPHAFLRRFSFSKRTRIFIRLPTVLAPDYSDTLDGGSWSNYHRIPDGGTSIASVSAALSSKKVLSLGAISSEQPESAGRFLERENGSDLHSLPLPMGIRATDALLETLETISGNSTPQTLISERARLVDAYVDGHKYLSGKTAVVFADPDLLVGICSLLNEIGIHVLGAATGSKIKKLEDLIHPAKNRLNSAKTVFLPNADHAAIASLCREVKPDIMIGNSKGYPISRELDIPLVRCGMPIHDRVGAQRTLHLGYAGAQRLFDTIVNTLLQHRQDTNEIGFSYL